MSAPLSKICIVGASGRVGGYFARALTATGKHTVTALSRQGSNSTVPDGVTTVNVDYDNHEELVKALKGQQFLIITLSTRAPPDVEPKITRAAVEAGVDYIMPNGYGYGTDNIEYGKENLHSEMVRQKIEYIESLGGKWINLCNGFWYQWSLALGENFFGIDIKNKKAVFFDDGKQHIISSTWDQCGRAVAALLSLPASGVSPSVKDWENKPLYISSFHITQRDMLDSVQRVTQTKDSDWTISHENSKERWSNAHERMVSGDHQAFLVVMYTRSFFPSGEGDFSGKEANEALKLPKEDLDAATKDAVEMVESNWNPWG